MDVVMAEITSGAPAFGLDRGPGLSWRRQNGLIANRYFLKKSFITSATRWTWESVISG
jgi:hypothetical protein